MSRSGKGTTPPARPEAGRFCKVTPIVILTLLSHMSYMSYMSHMSHIPRSGLAPSPPHSPDNPRIEAGEKPLQIDGQHLHSANEDLSLSEDDRVKGQVGAVIRRDSALL